MNNEILINVERGETRVALLEKGVFTELHLERKGEGDVVGSVIKGRVTRVLPGMQAAFVDIGLEKAAFLYAGDYFEDADLGDVEVDEDEAPRPRRGRGRNGRQQPPKIENVLHEGKEIAVQVAKEPIGTKGARITSNISIAGRHLVLTPWSRRVGVSRRIESDRERRRLREVVERLRPRDLGFITRTAGHGVREADLAADIKYLTEVWDNIQLRREEVGAPAVLYSEPKLPIRAIRDLAGGNTKRIVVDSKATYDEMKQFVSRFVAEPKLQIEHFQGKEPIFDHFGIEPQIDANLGRKVWLKSGGYLIIDQSEALTAIDVNTGSYVGKRDLEETVLRTNLEAVKEVVYQLRFRNIGGLIIIDLIDMESAANREKVYRALQEALRHDKARSNLLKISELGLVEMTRKRTRENLVQTVCEPCEYCEGKGYVLSRESVVYKIVRGIRRDLPRFCGQRVALTVNPGVAERLLGSERESLSELEAELGRAIEVRARPGMHQEQFEVEALDSGPAVEVALPWLKPAGAADAAAADDETEEAEAEAEQASEPAAASQTPAESPEPELPAEPAPEPQAAAPAELPEAAEPPSEPEAEPVDSEAEYRILPTPREPGDS